MSQTLETKLLATLKLIEKLENELQTNSVGDSQKRKKMKLLKELVKEQIPSLVPSSGLHSLSGLKPR